MRFWSRALTALLSTLIFLAVIAAAVGSLYLWDWLNGGSHPGCVGTNRGYEQCQDDVVENP